MATEGTKKVTCLAGKSLRESITPQDISNQLKVIELNNSQLIVDYFTIRWYLVKILILTWDCQALQANQWCWRICKQLVGQYETGMYKYTYWHFTVLCDLDNLFGYMVEQLFSWSCDMISMLLASKLIC